MKFLFFFLEIKFFTFLIPIHSIFSTLLRNIPHKRFDALLTSVALRLPLLQSCTHIRLRDMDLYQKHSNQWPIVTLKQQQVFFLL